MRNKSLGIDQLHAAFLQHGGGGDAIEKISAVLFRSSYFKD